MIQEMKLKRRKVCVIYVIKKKVLPKFKEKFPNIALRPVMLYETDFWMVKGQ